MKLKHEYCSAGRMEFSNLKSQRELLRFRMPDTRDQLKFYPASCIWNPEAIKIDILIGGRYERT